MNPANDPSETLPAPDGFDLDSVAGIIFTGDRRYLLQHRENRSDISHPGKWCLFGGEREHGESAEDALRREMLEELGFRVRRCEPFITCTFDAWFDRRRTRKFFFGVPATKQEARSMVLREGQGMAWLTLEELLARGEQLIPYDLGVIALHYGRVPL